MRPAPAETAPAPLRARASWAEPRGGNSGEPYCVVLTAGDSFRSGAETFPSRARFNICDVTARAHAHVLEDSTHAYTLARLAAGVYTFRRPSSTKLYQDQRCR